MDFFQGARPIPTPKGGTMNPPEPGKGFYAGKACAWPPRPPPKPENVRQITPVEMRSWIIYEDERLLVVNKPGDVVCHPSKAGPWSSLVGAAREYTALPTMHLVFRLDRETSGVVVLTKDSAMAGRLQTAMQKRKVGKEYQAILTGELRDAVTVDQPLGDDVSSPVYVKTTVRPDGLAAKTHFTPLKTANGFTLAKVVTESGQKHQIRAHALWLGHRLVGDKIYGPDDRLYLEFIDHGWSVAMADKLLLPRQALHCASIDLTIAGAPEVFRAPLAADMQDFCVSHGLTM